MSETMRFFVLQTSLVGVALILHTLFHYRCRHKFIALAENPHTLKSEKLWDFLFFTTQGIITVLIVPIAGVLLAYVFLMIPAAIAAIAAGSVAGLLFAYYLDFSVGPAIAFFLGAELILAGAKIRFGGNNSLV